MAHSSTEFCNVVHGKLTTLDGRVAALKANIGQTCHNLQDKLNEVRVRGEARQSAIHELRRKLETWFTEKGAEDSNVIEHWKTNRESQKLVERAERAEDHADYAIQLAEASMDEAERMILEAIAGRMEAESVKSDKEAASVPPVQQVPANAS